ncbi:response regulator transcription factor [Nocardia huaxiensis]|uniref:response regulator transcription factor n=1 Tax=Nocardia huaxiensis TaxID=2755382 RepID=UPI001E558F70|nr:response regulator transcription factor [Nocardia huaxiensis]UFS95606.1 response regulator transcription factor [Nocardia huaxiensis]
MSANLMIVEDDDRVRAALRLAMEDEGYDVSEAEEAEVALRLLRDHGAPDVVIVDLMLGGMDGFTCIREIRRDHDVPIIVVSARDDTHDVVAALEAGADDFVTKPFEVKEITARMRAVRRRMHAGSSGQPGSSRAHNSAAGEEEPELATTVLDEHPDAPLVLAPESGTVRRGDEQIHLTITEYRLLCELAGSAGRVFSRATLLERVWDQGFFGDERIVDVHIRRLRTKIERDPSDPRVVVTVRGLGYRLDVQR